MKEADNLNSRRLQSNPDQVPSPPATDQEEAFHNAWARNEDVNRIDVRNANEACTAPELRYIHRRLGDLTGRTILDIGCGCGEASVYFALKGAAVTALDISPGMLDLTAGLAQRYRTSLRLHQANANCLGLDTADKFDIIYAANVLHHVNIRQALPQMIAHLTPAGTFVSWDPLAYNPAINIYRRMAKAVRTEGEHALRREDVRFIVRQFQKVETKWCWLSTLIIFMLMATWQRRNPNKQRYWKAVVNEGDQWARLYSPLACIDEVLLKVVPPLRWWCWNVVIIGSAPMTQPLQPLECHTRHSHPRECKP